MDKQTAQLYSKFRANSPFMLVGSNAALALSSAKTLIRFRELEEQGKVRLRAEAEQDSYFDVYGNEDGYTNAQGHEVSAEQARENIIEQIERDGCWWVVSEYLETETCDIEDCKCQFHRKPRETWEQADSIGMCIYNDPTDPFENCYVIDLMDAAIKAYEVN